MNLINLLVVLLVCVYQGGVEGAVKENPSEDAYVPVGPVRDERSVELTIRNESASSDQSVILVGGREETAFTSLIRAANSDSRFEFSGKYTKADGFCVTGLQGRTNGEDGKWDISTFPKDGSDSVPITSDLDSVIPEAGDNLVFSFLPPRVTTIGFEKNMVSVKGGETVIAAIIRSGDLSTGASVEFYTADGSAKKDTHYEGVETSATFQPGINRTEVRVPTMGGLTGVKLFYLRLRTQHAEGSVKAVLGMNAMRVVLNP